MKRPLVISPRRTTWLRFKCLFDKMAFSAFFFFPSFFSLSPSLSGIRMLDGKATDTLEGSSLSFHSSYIDIYSCCWGPKDDGKRFGKPGYLASKALKRGAEQVSRKDSSSFFPREQTKKPLHPLIFKYWLR